MLKEGLTAAIADGGDAIFPICCETPAEGNELPPASKSLLARFLAHVGHAEHGGSNGGHGGGRGGSKRRRQVVAGRARVCPFFGIETERVELGASMPFIPPPACAGSPQYRRRPRDVEVVDAVASSRGAETKETKLSSSTSYLSEGVSWAVLAAVWAVVLGSSAGCCWAVVAQ
jgi:hypothetical protein